MKGELMQAFHFTCGGPACALVLFSHVSSSQGSGTPVGPDPAPYTAEARWKGRVLLSAQPVGILTDARNLSKFSLWRVSCLMTPISEGGGDEHVRPCR